tara:strand:+ start:2390 stop:2851 length:462 start_codon:yes stop_codon:yes gene_type:complete
MVVNVSISNYFNDLLYEDLQNLILSKIRKPQNKDLLNDIIDYKKSKDIIFNKYVNNGFTYDIDNTFYIYYQIENDLMGYYNEDIALLDWITIKNIEKLERILSIKYKLENNKDKTLDDIFILNNMSSNSRINILLGSLTISERESFINNIYSS